MNDTFGNEIEIGDIIIYTDNNSYHTGLVEYDQNYRGHMRVDGRSISDILDHCADVRVISNE